MMLKLRQFAGVLVVGALPLCAVAQNIPVPEPAASPIESISAAPVPQPAHVANVQYQGGQLNIATEDARLGDVLAQVSTKTGIHIEVAPAVAASMVTTILGPADPKEVLIKLLRSPEIDYIMLSSTDDPDAVARIEVKAAARDGAVVASQQPAEEEKETTEGDGNIIEEKPAAQVTAQGASETAPDESKMSPNEQADYWRRAQEAQLSLERTRNLQQMQLIDEMAKEEAGRQPQQEPQPKKKPTTPK